MDGIEGSVNLSETNTALQELRALAAQARRRSGFKMSRYLRSGTPLGSDCPAVLNAARTRGRANLLEDELWYLRNKQRTLYKNSRLALDNDDSEAAEKYLRKAKELRALIEYEEKQAEIEALTYLRALKKAMNTALNFERLQLTSNEMRSAIPASAETTEADQIKQRQRQALWSEALQLERKKFCAHILCHAPPAPRNKKTNSAKNFTHSKVMTGGAPI